MQPKDVYTAQTIDLLRAQRGLTFELGRFEVQQLCPGVLRYTNPAVLKNEAWAKLVAATRKQNIYVAASASAPVNNSTSTNYKDENGCISWDAEGCSFSLTADGKLCIDQFDESFAPSFYLVGLKEIKVSAGNFKLLDIIGGEVEFVDDCFVESLQVKAKSVLNVNALKAINATIWVSIGLNAGKIQVAKSADMQADDFVNTTGEVQAGEKLNFIARKLHNDGGKIYGLVETNVRIRTDYTCDELSEIGNAASKTTVKFLHAIMRTKLGIVRGSRAELINAYSFSNRGSSVDWATSVVATNRFPYSSFNVSSRCISAQRPNSCGAYCFTNHA